MCIQEQIIPDLIILLGKKLKKTITPCHGGSHINMH